MQVQVHTDATIQGGDSLETWAKEEINTKLARLKEYVVRVEVFLTGVMRSRPLGARQEMRAGNPCQRSPADCRERRGRKGQRCL